MLVVDRVKRMWLAGLVINLLLLSQLPTPSWAQSNPTRRADILAVSSANGNTQIEWGAGDTSAVTAASAWQTLPKLRFQGYELPMQLLTLRLAAPEQVASLITEQITTQVWASRIQPAAPLQPQVLDWEPAPTDHPVEIVALPTAPVFVVRHGQVDGQPIAVVAISPFYEENGVVKLATHFKVQAPAATPIQAADLATSSEQLSSAAVAAVGQPGEFAPTNPAAATRAVKVVVRNPGLQQVLGQALVDAGFTLAGLDPAKLHLTHKGQPIALQVLDLNNGQLTAASKLRFYAPKVGDRWNLTEVYWLTVESVDGLRMAVRAATPAGASGRSDAFEQGAWADYKLYNSLLPGANGEHWFHTDLRVATSSAEPVGVSLSQSNRLPLISGQSTFSVSVSTAYKAQYNLAVQMGSDVKVVSWHSAPEGSLIHNHLLTVTTTQQPEKLVLSVSGSDSKSALSLQQIFWQRPVSLDFQRNGAIFSGVAGTFTYSWQNPAPGLELYDITEPTAPQILAGAQESGFQDGPQARNYLLAGPGTLFSPETIASPGYNFSASDGATAIYIAPVQFMASLDPLVNLRRSQGHMVKVINVQNIYDSWSYGQVSAPAIRTFLRFAYTNWQPHPEAVILVGDGTWDPHNYENKAQSINYIPPYVATVDPWLGETACERCYTQLNGDDPLTGDEQADNSEFFETELLLGRFPVRSVEGLNGVVSKIVRYESNTLLAPWRGSSIFLADNYVQGYDANGSAVYDAAGDFARISDEVVAMQDARQRINRYYYDPYPQLTDPEGKQPWRVPGASAVRDAAISAMNGGAAFVTFNGHSNHWQWARLDGDSTVTTLFSLYDPDALVNNDRFFIAMSMTCLTSQFHKPADSGTTLDERMFLNATGGAVAVWGPAGLSVVHGHDALQRGFYRALWSAAPRTARLGALVEAGHHELLTNSVCCQDVQKTFLLTGDPLMIVQAMPLDSIYLPQVGKAQ